MILDFELQNFDRDDKNNIGRPFFFDPDVYLSVVEQMIVSDEVDRAIWMLDNMPGWYRDNYPPRARSIREQLLKKLYTTQDYLKGESEGHIDLLVNQDVEITNKAYMNSLGRAKVALGLCQELNGLGFEPHIFEVAPGEFWLPIGLKKNDVKFTYEAVSLNGKLSELGYQYLFDKLQLNLEKPKAQIFVCFELIEHLRYPTEIYQHYLKSGREFTHILLSTPKYTVATVSPQWYESDLGHLRTYTPKEFCLFATAHWPEFKWILYDDDIMVLKGERIKTTLEG